MRTAYRLAAIALAFGVSSAARAQEPINPYEPATAPPPPTVMPPTVLPPPGSTTTTTTTTTTTPPAQPINPYAPPGQFGYQPPAPGRYHSTPPNYNQGYYLYSQPGQPPVYYAPPPSYNRYQLSCAQLCAERRPARKWDGVRRFSLGVHGTVMGLNQKFDGESLVLGGAGFQLRLRSKGRFGFEARQSFLRGEAWNGAFVRNSYPFSLSLMVYIFPNQDARRFNLYFLGGVGVMADTVRVRFAPGEYREQDFLEVEAHLGVGAELRFKWFAIEADVRGFGFWRDNTGRPATYYNNVPGGPIPNNTWALSGNLYVSLWF